MENAILFGRTNGRLARFSRDRRITLVVPALIGDVTAELDVELLLVELGERGSINLLSMLLSFVDAEEDNDDDERDDGFGRLTAMLRGRMHTLVGVLPEIQGVALLLPFELMQLAMPLVFVMFVLTGVHFEAVSSLAKQGVKLSLSNEVVGNLCI